VREGTLQVGLKGKGKPSEASVYVFNDLILLAKKKKEKWRIQLARARLIVVAEQDSTSIPPTAANRQPPRPYTPPRSHRCHRRRRRT